MRIYLAGVEQASHRKKLIEAGIQRALAVVWYNWKLDVDSLRIHIPDLFIDSGAFSAYTRGQEIDYNKYVGWLLENKDKVTCYASLDVIGDWRKTLDNHHAMKKLGLRPIWTFHARGNEPYELLRDMIQEDDYIALGGMASKRAKLHLFRHLDRCFSIIAGYWTKTKDGTPKKIHGFGLTSGEFLDRYPFYSTDATTWLHAERSGLLYIWQDGKLIRASIRRKDHVLKYMKTADQHVDRDGMKLYRSRSMYSAHSIVKMEQFYTELWRQRGIEWKPKPSSLSSPSPGSQRLRGTTRVKEPLNK